MKKYALLFFIALMPAVQILAQDDTAYRLKSYDISLHDNFDVRRERNDDPENSTAYALTGAVAPVRYLSLMPDSMRWGWVPKGSSIVVANFDNRNGTGYYLHDEGRQRTFGSLTAGGQISRNRGTLYGMASYRNGQRTDVELNYATHTEMWKPYLVGDTLGAGRISQEIYTVMAGYSTDYKRFLFGLEARYEGIAQARKHNPRHSNYSQLTRLTLASGYHYGKGLVNLALSPEWGSQQISASSLVNGMRYFVFFGFGQWNRRESMAAVAYGRLQKMSGFGAKSTWIHRGAWNIMMEVGWNYRKAEFEESSIKRLFTTHTHSFSQQINIGKVRHDWALFVQATAMENLRKGQEGVYENQLRDPEQGLYDYTLVGTNKLYSRNRYLCDLRAKFVSKFSGSAKWYVLAGVSVQNYDETYKSPTQKVSYTTLSPDFSTGVNCTFGKVETRLSAGATLRYGLAGRCDVSNKTPVYGKMVEIPYLVNSSDEQIFRTKMSVVVPTGSHLSLGAEGQAVYVHAYNRREVGLNFSLFALF